MTRKEMAQLFVEDGTGWSVAPLDGNGTALWGDVRAALRPRAVAGADTADRPVILRTPDLPDGEQWVVIHAPGRALRVNGAALVTGIRVLAHRDELRVAGVPGRLFFSLEGLARVAPFDGLEGGRCPRCQQPIDRGSPAVCCPHPQCGVWHHQSEELGCWTYSPTCSLCDQPTDLDGTFRWTPEESAGRG